MTACNKVCWSHVRVCNKKCAMIKSKMANLAKTVEGCTLMSLYLKLELVKKTLRIYHLPGAPSALRGVKDWVLQKIPF